MNILFKSVMGSAKKFYVLEDANGDYIDHADSKEELIKCIAEMDAFEEAYANDPDARIVLPYQDQMDEEDIKELSRRAYRYEE